MYNVESWIEKTIQSIMSQVYLDYKCTIIDDCSTDKSATIVTSLTKDDSRFILIKNTTKKNALANILAGIQASKPNDEDVIITVDGDDWLAHENVLNRIKGAYDTTNCMMTHGSYQEYPSGTPSHGWMQELPDIVKLCGLYRWYTWQLSHLRTFKYKLFKHIKDKDLKNDLQNYYDMAWDLALMYPLAELCDGNITYIDDVLYIYNRETPLNDDKVNEERQLNCAADIQKKQKYSPVFNHHHSPITKAISIKQLKQFKVPPTSYSDTIQYYEMFAQMLTQLNRADDAAIYHNAIKHIQTLSKKKPFVSCFLKGGLGNQLFQIATCIAYGYRHNIEVKFFKQFSTPIEGHRKTTYWDSIFHLINLEKEDVPDFYSIYKEPHHHYSSIPASDQSQFLFGYFQSEKYFADFRSEILNLFTPPDSLTQPIQKKYKSLLSKNNTVSVHIRRGDYLKSPDYHPILPVDYYKKAMEQFQNHQFVVFSDDIDWCKSAFNSFDSIQYIEGHDDMTDLYLMSQMKHHIIANSSFSWWGAWLCQHSQKRVITPSIWFGHANGDHTIDDLIPKEWCVIIVPNNDPVKFTFSENFGQNNKNNRDEFVIKNLKSIPPKKRLLDVGAGESQYKPFCSHLNYVSQDIAEYNSNADKTGLHYENWDFSKINIICDITDIPEPNESFDVILCTEVLEHVPDPALVFPELSRLLKPEGTLILTAPFCSLTHFAPYHFSTGFNAYYYDYHLAKHNLNIIKQETNGNYFSYLAQELFRLPSIAKQYSNIICTSAHLKTISHTIQLLSDLEKNDTHSNELLCHGYHIVAQKTSPIQ